jgi:hypothetical protein
LSARKKVPVKPSAKLNVPKLVGPRYRGIKNFTATAMASVATRELPSLRALEMAASVSLAPSREVSCRAADP